MVAEAAAAVLEPVVVTVMVMVTVTGTGTGMVGVMVSLLAIAMMPGPATRSATAVGQRSLHLAVSIARIGQRNACPLRRRDGRIRPAG